MRWFRSNRKTGGRLALFALAVQFVVAFGHIHPQDIYGSLDSVASSTLRALTARENVQSLSTDQATKQSDDFCAICAAVSLLNNSFAAEAPHLVLPVASRTVLKPDRVAAIFVEPRRASFQSRAPPTA
jgi:thiamine pyrophosphokinase